MAVNRSFFRRPKCSGSPRYFPFPPSLWIPRICLAASLMSFGVLLVFLVYAEEGGAACLIWVVEEHCIVSKQEVVHPGLPLATLTPWSEPSCAACLHNPDRTSPQGMNMYGDRGSPCLIPQCPILKKAWTSLVIASPITCQYAPITRLYCLGPRSILGVYDQNLQTSYNCSDRMGRSLTTHCFQ